MQKVIPTGLSGKVRPGRYDEVESAALLPVEQLFDVLSQSEELCDDINDEVVRRARIWVVDAINTLVKGAVVIGNSDWFVEYDGIRVCISNIVLESRGHLISVSENNSRIELSTVGIMGEDVFCALDFDLDVFDKAVFGDKDFFVEDTDLQGFPIVELAKIGAITLDLQLACEFELQSRLFKFLIKSLQFDEITAEEMACTCHIMVVNGYVILNNYSKKEAQIYKRLYYEGGVKVFDKEDVSVCIPIDYFEETINE